LLLFLLNLHFVVIAQAEVSRWQATWKMENTFCLFYICKYISNALHRAFPKTQARLLRLFVIIFCLL